MSEELQQKLRDQLWEVANKLRGNMSASDFMYWPYLLQVFVGEDRETRQRRIGRRRGDVQGVVGYGEGRRRRGVAGRGKD